MENNNTENNTQSDYTDLEVPLNNNNNNSSNTSDTFEFIADDVTSNRSNTVRRMLIKEYRKIGRGAFGTVVQAYMTPNKENWYGPFAIKKVTRIDQSHQRRQEHKS